jgi:Flp pilus assembly pilin Flp
MGRDRNLKGRTGAQAATGADVGLPRALRRFCRQTQGVTSVEYAMLLACILAVALVAVNTLGSANLELWHKNSFTLKLIFTE